MCTVSFVALENQFCITSNRDEQVSRPATPPATYTHKQKQLTYPKDPQAGGTWFAADDRGNVLVLLNGAKEKHLHTPPYNKSRGIIVLELLEESDCIDAWDRIDLNRIEPFTIVLFFNQQLYQLQWDGKVKELNGLDRSLPHIWSSSTLYEPGIRKSRAEWFRNFLSSEKNLTAGKLLHFHRYTETDNRQNGLVINRNDNLKTLSITQALVNDSTVNMTYTDLIGDNQNAALAATS